MVLFEDQIYFTYPPSIFTPPSEVYVCDAGPTLHNTSVDLIQLGGFFWFFFDMTGVSRYETDEQNVQQTWVWKTNALGGYRTSVLDAARLFSLLHASGDGVYCMILHMCHEKGLL